MKANCSVPAFWHVFGIAAISLVLTGCAREKPTPVVPARAVTVMKLAESDPALRLRLPGSVAPWKQEAVGFQVAGRVNWVIEADQDVAGPGSDADYDPSGTGDEIAILDPSRYEAALKSAEANRDAAQAQAEATSIHAKVLIPREMRVAEIEQQRSAKELERIKKAVTTGSVAQLELDNAHAAYATAVANYEALVARRNTKLVELRVHQAQKQQSEEARNQADLDLKDTHLYAPFDARVSQVHVTQGTIVAAGTPVVTLVVMDPIKVEVVVSAAKHRQLETDDEVFVHTSKSAEPIRAIVYQKSATASATTRTFKVTLLCRNQRISGLEQKPGVAAVPITGFMRPQQFEVNGVYTWFIEEQCLHKQDGGGHFAWRVVNPDGRPANEPLDLERVSLKLGNIHKNLFGLYRFRQLHPQDPLYAELEESNVGDERWRMVLAANVPDDYTGGKVIRATRRWRIRPGDIVSVQLDVEARQPGIYVPKRFIRVEGDKHFVFLVDDVQGKRTAKKVPVELLDDKPGKLAAGESTMEITPSIGMHRIAGEGIEPGVRMVTSGMHYLEDGDEIQVLEVER